MSSLSPNSPQSASPIPVVNPRTSKKPRRRGWSFTLLTLLLLGGLATAGYFFLGPRAGASKRPDLILHAVKFEALPVSVVGKGSLESADNRDIICKVKAGSKGTFASTIKWVIDDGSVVSKGQLLIELDDSALEEQYKQQSIVVDKARAEWVKADKEFLIQQKESEALSAQAVATLRGSELDLDKFVGLRAEPALNPFGAIVGAHATVMEKGEYRQKLDDISARLKASESDLEAYRERSAWAERSAKIGYITQSQSKVEQSKLSGASDNYEKLQKEKFILENFEREKQLTDLRSKMEVAKINVEKAVRQAEAKEVQAESERKTKLSVLQREEDRLKEIEEQLHECKIHAPQDGMVVYYKSEQSRNSSSQQLIAVGEQVREGQKLMRIPDLRRMQVNTRVHEAQVARIRGDDRQPTHVVSHVRAGMLTMMSPFARLVGQTDPQLETIRDILRDKEYEVRREGHRATVRVDAYPDRTFAARVRMVAAVAAQADWFSSDVKVYQTQVLITESVVGLKPDMNAEVTIHIDDAVEPVLAIPLQSVVGGAEAGQKRTVFVMTSSGPVEKEVTLGKFNDAMIEVKSGLSENDEVVVNPRAVAGDKAKTREGNGSNRGGPPGAGGEKKGPPGAGGEGKKKGGMGGGGGGMGGPPKGPTT